MNLQRGQSAPTPRRRKDDVAPGLPHPVNGAVAAGNDDRPFFRLNLRRALQLHRRLAMGIALAGLVLALAYVAMTWPVYTAQSQIYIQPVQPKVMIQGNDQGGAINPAAYDSFVQQQVQSASNPEVLLNALHKLGPGAWQKSDESEQAAAGLADPLKLCERGPATKLRLRRERETRSCQRRLQTPWPPALWKERRAREMPAMRSESPSFVRSGIEFKTN
jgi:hypothetical protein